MKTKVGIHIDVFRDVKQGLITAIERFGGDASKLLNHHSETDLKNSLGIKAVKTEMIDGDFHVETDSEQLRHFYLDYSTTIYGNPTCRTERSISDVAKLSKLYPKMEFYIYSTDKTPFLANTAQFLLGNIIQTPEAFESLNIQLGVQNPDRIYDIVISDNLSHLEEETSDIYVGKSQTALAKKFMRANNFEEISNHIKTMQ